MITHEQLIPGTRLLGKKGKKYKVKRLAGVNSKTPYRIAYKYTGIQRGYSLEDVNKLFTLAPPVENPDAWKIAPTFTPIDLPDEQLPIQPENLPIGTRLFPRTDRTQLHIDNGPVIRVKGESNKNKPFTVVNEKDKVPTAYTLRKINELFSLTPPEEVNQW